MASASNVSFASPLADASYAKIVDNSHVEGLLASISELSGWTIALTILAVLVAYDQCKPTLSFSAIQDAAKYISISLAVGCMRSLFTLIGSACLVSLVQ